MAMFKIMENSVHGYFVQVWRWWWPWWLTVHYGNTDLPWYTLNLEEAEAYIENATKTRDKPKITFVKYHP